MIFSVLYLVERDLPATGKIFITRPFRFFAVSGGFILLLFLTYEADFQQFEWERLLKGNFYQPWAGNINFAVLMLFTLLFVVLTIRGFSRQSWSERFVTLLPVFVLLLLISGRQHNDFMAMVLANIYLLTWGIAYLVEGIQMRSMGFVNLGMLFILVLATARFFDTEWDFIIKGIAFIVLGLGFLIANWILSKRLKSKSP